jgi:hypothetical protein
MGGMFISEADRVAIAFEVTATFADLLEFTLSRCWTSWRPSRSTHG